MVYLRGVRRNATSLETVHFCEAAVTSLGPLFSPDMGCALLKVLYALENANTHYILA